MGMLLRYLIRIEYIPEKYIILSLKTISYTFLKSRVELAIFFMATNVGIQRQFTNNQISQIRKKFSGIPENLGKFLI